MNFPINFNLAIGDLVKVSHYFLTSFYHIGEVIDVNLDYKILKVKFLNKDDEEKEMWFSQYTGTAVNEPKENEKLEFKKDGADAKYFLSKQLVYPYEKSEFLRNKMLKKEQQTKISNVEEHIEKSEIPEVSNVVQKVEETEEKKEKKTKRQTKKTKKIN